MLRHWGYLSCRRIYGPESNSVQYYVCTSACTNYIWHNIVANYSVCQKLNPAMANDTLSISQQWHPAAVAGIPVHGLQQIAPFLLLSFSRIKLVMLSGGLIHLHKTKSVRFYIKEVPKTPSKVTAFNGKAHRLYYFTNVHVADQKLSRISTEVFPLLRALTQGVLK